MPCKPLALVPKRNDLLMKPEILADGPREIIVGLQLVNVTPKTQWQIVDALDRGCP